MVFTDHTQFYWNSGTQVPSAGGVAAKRTEWVCGGGGLPYACICAPRGIDTHPVPINRDTPLKRGLLLFVPQNLRMIRFHAESVRYSFLSAIRVSAIMHLTGRH